MIPKELRYTKEHEWVRLEGSEAVFGITDHAQSALGDITFVELPKLNREIKQSEGVAIVESVKAASDVYAPLSGKVVKINESLQDKPEQINKSPYGDGWLCRINVSNSGEVSGLMDAAAYEAYLKQEV